MKKLISISFVLAAIAAAAIAAEKVAIADLLKDPAKYDGKAVMVIGKVKEFKQRTSKAGNPYFTFKVETDGKRVSIYGRGKQEPELKDDQSVQVTGKFAKEKKVGSLTFKNELDITVDSKDDKTKDFGVKIRE